MALMDWLRCFSILVTAISWCYVGYQWGYRKGKKGVIDRVIRINSNTRLPSEVLLIDAPDPIEAELAMGLMSSRISKLQEEFVKRQMITDKEDQKTKPSGKS